MIETLAYMLYLAGAKSVAESSHKHKIRARESRLDEWYRAHGFTNMRRQEQLRQYAWDHRREVYEEMTGTTYFETYLCQKILRDMTRYLCEKEGLKYFEYWEWCDDPTYKAANKY